MIPALLVLRDRWILAVAGVVTVFQLLYAFLADPTFNADGYLELGEDFGNYWQYAHFADTMRTPGYPLLLAGFYETGLDATGLKIFQTGLITAGLLVLAKVAELTGGRRAARICAWLFVAYVPIWSYSAIARTEAVAVPLLIFAVLALMLTVQYGRNRTSWVVVTGAMCGLALIVRPNSASAVAIVAAVLLYVVFREKRSARATVKAAVLFLLPVVVIFTPWVARNLSHEGGPEPLGHNPFPLPLGVHLPYETQIGKFASFERSRTFFGKERSDGFTPKMALETDSWAVLEDNLRHHTDEFLATRAVAEFQMWPWPATPRVDYGEESVVPYPLLMLLHLFVLIAGLIGLYRLRGDPVGMIGLASIAMLFALHLLYVAHPRYTVPVFPFLLVGAAVLLSRYVEARSPLSLPD